MPLSLIPTFDPESGSLVGWELSDIQDVTLGLLLSHFLTAPGPPPLIL